MPHPYIELAIRTNLGKFREIYLKFLPKDFVLAILKWVAPVTMLFKAMLQVSEYHKVVILILIVTVNATN